MYTHVHSNIIYNSQKVDANQISIDGWKDKQNVIYLHNAMLLLLYFIFCVHYSMLTTKIYFPSITIIDSFYPFHPPPHSPLVTTAVCFVSVCLGFLVRFVHLFCFVLFLCSTYGWNHNSIWLSLSDLFHFSIMSSRSMDVDANSKISSFFYAWVKFYFNVAFSFHSSIDKHSVCFHILAIINNAAVNIGLYTSFWINVNKT